MMTSPRFQSSKTKAECSDMEFQTPAISEKFQSRFGWRANRTDDTGLGTTAPDSAEELCSSASNQSFHPIRSQIPIPTAHIMPSTSNCGSAGSRPPLSLSKSASSPNLEAEGGVSAGGGVTTTGGGVKQDCLSRYRSLVNGLDHSLFPTGDQTRLDFETPAVEPTLNQSGLLGGLFGGYTPDVRMQLHMTGLGDTAECRFEGYPGALEQTYKVLPEARTGGPCPSDCERNVHLGPGATDPSDWHQHKQRLENLRLQVEKLMTAGGQYPSLYPSTLQTESKWEAVVKANENLLKEKELIIERQKQQLFQLEQRLRESELQIHAALMGRGAPLSDVCLLRLQEAQRENAFLRSQFAECSETLAQDKLEAERRLAAVEAETHRLSEALKESKEKHTEELKKQEERIRNRDKHISSLKKKCQKECEQNREKQQRIETLERYLADLPTMEDYQSQRKQLEAAEQKVAEVQASVLELETQLKETRSANQSKDKQLEEQRLRERELLNTVTSLQARVQEGLEDGARLPSLDIEKLREENTALKEEQQRLKKVIEKQLRMMEQLGSQIRNVQQHLCEEESSSQALRNDLEAKEKELHQLHSAVKELSVQNQELMEQGVSLRERLQAARGSGEGCVQWEAKGGVKLTQQLHREMEACLRDLNSICNVVTHTAHGKDPNLSMLLGISSAPVVLEQSEDWLSPAVLQRKLQEVLQLRRDVEALRTTVSDRYAQDMGDNCTTQ
ncbi:centrosomal protein of 85 kDa [Hoplias malabaricus]|uniref:centrosomal protein of 85 kDa n=1 Tax=Hoplias malabaricus TaxID=27720 RepID=UPI003461872D